MTPARPSKSDKACTGDPIRSAEPDIITALIKAGTPVRVSRKDVAKMLSISERTLIRWIEGGVVPNPRKDGVFVYWYNDEVTDFMTALRERDGAS